MSGVKKNKRDAFFFFFAYEVFKQNMRSRTTIHVKKCKIYTYFCYEELVHKYTCSDEDDEERKGEKLESVPEVTEDRNKYITERHIAYVDEVKNLLKRDGYAVTIGIREWNSTRTVMTTDIEYRLEARKLFS